LSISPKIFNLHLTATNLEDPLGSVTLETLPVPRGSQILPSPTSLTPLEERWWQWASHDIQNNIVEQRYFGAGREFGPTVFTRDLALSGVLALNRLCPETMWSSLRFDRELRFGVDWRVTVNSSACETTGFPFETTPYDYTEFVTRYRTGDFSRRTDDVVWLWAAQDWLRLNGTDRNDWIWAYETGKRCFSRYYDHFFDSSDGLYRGQPCFVDIMMCGYQATRFQEHPKDAINFFVNHVDNKDDDSLWRFGLFPASLRRSISGKAASTNALYVIGLKALAEMADHLGAHIEASEWLDRAKKLKTSVARTFIRPDGAIAYFKEVCGTLDVRQHALGTALCVLADIVTESEAQQALRYLPINWYGIPLFDPFYTDNPHCYHNHSAWPFVDGIVHFAALHANIDPERTVSRWRALCGRACRDHRGFRELNDTTTGRLIGSGHQLWSAAAYCGSFLVENRGR
jgi:hypothetical protein